MRKVYLAQVKCPNNHCIVAGAAELEAERAQAFGETVMMRFESMIAAHALNRKCELCGATEFHIDVGATIYRTMEEARPHLMQSEMAEMITRHMWRASRN